MWNNRVARFVFLVFSALLVLHLASPDAFARKKKGPQPFQTTAQVPSMDLEAVQDFPAVREMGGVRIELIPEAFRATELVLQEIYQRRGFCFPTSNIPVTVKHTPVYQLDPKNVQFKLRITNHLGKLLRLEGVGLVFEVNGNAVAADYTENDIQKAMIPPEKSWEGTLQGSPVAMFFEDKDPETETLKPSGMFRVGIYDVITEVDEASNPTKRSNFEWLYSYDVGLSSREVTGDLNSKACITPQQWSTFGGVKVVEAPSAANKAVQPKP